MPAEDSATPDDPGAGSKGLFTLYVNVNDDGTCDVKLGEVEPGHIPYIFSPTVAQAVEAALFATAAVKYGPPGESGPLGPE